MEEQPARGLEAYRQTSSGLGSLSKELELTKVAEQLGPLERDFDEVTNLSDLVI
jgi:hypothetical protein